MVKAPGVAATEVNVGWKSTPILGKYIFYIKKSINDLSIPEDEFSHLRFTTFSAFHLKNFLYFCKTKKS